MRRFQGERESRTQQNCRFQIQRHSVSSLVDDHQNKNKGSGADGVSKRRSKVYDALEREAS